MTSTSPHDPAAPQTALVTPDAPRRSLARTLVGSLLPFVLAIAAAELLQVFGPRALGPYYARLLLDVGIAMILAVSLNLVNGLTGQFSIGHAGFMALGGYVAGGMTYYVTLSATGTTDRLTSVPGAALFACACLVGGLVSAVAGYIVGLPSLRLRGDYLAIVTLGFGEILRVILQQTNPVLDSPDELRSATWGQLIPPPVGGAIGFDGLPKYTSLFWVATFLALTVIVSLRLKFSSIGRAMLSVSEDETAAQATGVNVTRYKVLAFVVAAFFAGIGGALMAHQTGVNISPRDAGFQRSFDYIIMTVLGGRGSMTGVMLAAGLLTVLPELLRGLEQYRLIVYSLLLIGTMLVRPQGLFGASELWELWSRRAERGPSRKTLPASSPAASPAATDAVAPPLTEGTR